MTKPSSKDLSSALNRRHLLQTTAGGLAAFVLADALSAEEKPVETEKAVTRGRIKQSVCRWCYSGLKLPDLAKHSAAMGIAAIEMVDPKEWPILKQFNLICAMTSSHSIGKGFNDPANHAECIAAVKKAIDVTAEAGYPNVICFSGNRTKKISDEAGLNQCIEGLKQVIRYAEEKNITLCMELLNSRLNHKNYMCDTVEWGAEVCKGVGSPNMKLLFDIYHVQVQQGDIIARIRQFHKYIGHYHTAGVPGRNELDENQELNYPAIMRAIADTGFQGYVGQEFIPTQSPLEKLRDAVKLCDV